MKRFFGWFGFTGSIRAAIAVALVAIGLSAGFAPVQAQATRTWVSGVGDDANPCSRTAPCKTFAGAISKTAPNGIINCIDPGGFGAVTITKSITIDCEGTFGGILAAGTNGVNINAANIVVNLRHLSIEGVGTGLVGVNFLQGSSVNIEDCVIFGFNSGSGRGVYAQGGAAGTFQQLFIKNSTISDNGLGIAGGGGVVIGVPAPGAPTAGIVRGFLDNVSLLRNNVGLRISPGSESTMRHSSAAGNISFNLLSASGGGAAFINVDDSTFSESIAGTGMRAEGPGAQIRLNRSSVYGNNIGIEFFNGGAILSSANNVIQGNFTSNGAPSGASPLS